ncbi:hypothetical protein QJS04_geneDACA003217 [Acorus gramineus]|uniref:Uncharacterized protein n=1 Tax=Acorus gramineus TaxID=55184 RepID=A0AAV9BYC2_ACOGR|nr:hypothetical protein QJS04_geneDACA003217 [Acorus gramineus]
MDILGLIFPTSFFQHVVDHQQTLSSNVSAAKCSVEHSAFSDISLCKSSRKQNKVSRGSRSLESVNHVDSCQKLSDSPSVPSIASSADALDVKNSSGQLTDSSDINKTGKTVTKKKHGKKSANHVDSCQKLSDSSSVPSVASSSNVSDVKNSSGQVTDSSDMNKTGKTVAKKKHGKKKHKAKTKHLDTEPPAAERAVQACPSAESVVSDTVTQNGVTDSLGNVNSEIKAKTCVPIHAGGRMKHSPGRGNSSRHGSVSKDWGAENSINTRFVEKHHKKEEGFPGTAAIPSSSNGETTGVCRKDAADVRISIGSSHDQDSVDGGRQIQPNGWEDGYGNTSICDNRVYCLVGSTLSDSVCVNDCDHRINEQMTESLSLGSLSKDSDGMKSSGQSSTKSHWEAKPSKRIDGDWKQSGSSNGTSHASHHPISHTKTGKENTQLAWQKTGNSIRATQTLWVKRPRHPAPHIVAVSKKGSMLTDHNNLSSTELPTPVTSCDEQCGFLQGAKDLRINEQALHQKHGPALTESHQWVYQRRLHGSFGQSVSQSRGNDVHGNKGWERSGDKLGQSHKQESNSQSKKELLNSRPCLYRPKGKMNVFQKESFDVSKGIRDARIEHDYPYQRLDLSRTRDMDRVSNCSPCSAHQNLDLPCPNVSSLPTHPLLHESEPRDMLRNSRIKSVTAGVLHVSGGGTQTKCLETDLSYGNEVRQCTAPRLNSKQWVQVHRRDFDDGGFKKTEIYGTDSLLSSETNSSLRPGTIYNYLSHEAHSGLLRSSAISCTGRPYSDDEKCPQEISKNCLPSGLNRMNTSLLDNGSFNVMRALNVAYQSQLASESIQLLTGSPLADFERVLHSASPVIVPSFVRQLCNECFVNQPINSSLCKHKIPPIPLCAIWNWYEKPGSYGLEVKAEDSCNLDGLDTDTVSFYAHFVPFLSAVQLFSPTHQSDCHDTGRLSYEIPDKGEDTSFSFPLERNPIFLEIFQPNSSEGDQINMLHVFNSEEKQMGVSNLPVPLTDKSLDLTSALVCLDSSELIFEYFEHEKPPQRKPLFEKYVIRPCPPLCPTVVLYHLSLPHSCLYHLSLHSLLLECFFF